MASIDEIINASKHYADRSATNNAAEVADAALRTCLQAVELLEGRLRELGYPVTPLIIPPKNGLTKRGDLRSRVPAGSGDPRRARRIERIESHTGLAIPALLKRIWAIIGGLRFVDLEDYSHVEFWDRLGIKGKKGFCDGVCIDSCTKDWLEFTMEDFDNLCEDDAEDEFYYSISPDGYHKDDISGGDSYGVRDGDWMPELLNFTWSGSVKPSSVTGKSIDLLGYLRTSLLECGGFPGFLGNKAFEPIRLRLIENLPPF